MRAWPAKARKAVEARDKGVCAECGLDTGAISREARRLYRLDFAHGGRLWARVSHQIADALRPGFRDLLRHLWEADHIVPVAEGGGGCGLENLRTLCLACHKEATAALRRRLAAASP